MSSRALHQIDRRQLLKAAISAGLVIPGLPLLGGSPARAQFKTNPFTLGVASGDPQLRMGLQSGPASLLNPWVAAVA